MGLIFRDKPAVGIDLESIQPHAGFHFTVCEAHLIHGEPQVPHSVLLDEEDLLLQPQLSPQPDFAPEPYFHLVPERQSHPPRQLLPGQAPAGNPFAIARFRMGTLKVELALLGHGFSRC